MVGMFQKEVAQRVASGEGSKVYGVTSVLVQAFFDVEYLFEVDEACIYSSPKSEKRSNYPETKSQIYNYEK